MILRGSWLFWGGSTVVLGWCWVVLGGSGWFWDGSVVVLGWFCGDSGWFWGCSGLGIFGSGDVLGRFWDLLGGSGLVLGRMWSSGDCHMVLGILGLFWGGSRLPFGRFFLQLARPTNTGDRSHTISISVSWCS